MPSQGAYDDFLAGIGSSNWILSKTRLVGGDFDEDLYRSNRYGKWTAARITGVVVGATVSVVLFVFGSLLLLGVIVFTATVVAPKLVAPAPPSPSPPLSPPRPQAPENMMELAESTCAISTAGIVVSAVRNRVCQDGGDGSTTNECALGTDFPDCPVRLANFPPAPPPDHPSPATEPPSKPPSPPSPPPPQLPLQRR